MIDLILSVHRREVEFTMGINPPGGCDEGYTISNVPANETSDKFGPVNICVPYDPRNNFDIL